MKQLFILLVLFLGLIFAKDAVDIKVNQPGQLVIEISIDSTWISPKDQLIQTVPSLDAYFQPGFPVIPYYQEVLIGVSANADVKVFSGKEELVGSYYPNLLGPEKAQGMEFKLPIVSKFDGYFPKQSVKLSPTMDVNGLPSTKIEIFPFSIQDGQLFVTKNISIQISWDAALQSFPAKILSNMSLGELKATKKLKKPTEHIIPEYQFSNNIAKIVVDTSAWYKITSSGLISIGINLVSVNPNTIRLWYKEDEIPLHIEDGNDGSFNNEDIIVFYGKKNPAPEGVDYKNNFYTDENVYWLTWGTGKGKRFSEENVSPDKQKDTVYIPENYRFNKKIERDDKYVRLNRLNHYLLQTWDVIDHFYMSPQIIVGRPFEFEFELDSLNVLSDEGFDLELYVRGMTKSEHDLDIMINNNLITNGKWANRNVLNIRQTNINCSYLKNGINTLSLILSPSDSTLHDLIYLNWYEIKYPKYFHTEKDYIYFSVDSIPDQKPVQFEITGFSNSDILLLKNRETLLSNFQISYDNHSDDYLLKFQDDKVIQSSLFEAITYDNLLNVKSINKENPIAYSLSNINSSYIAVAPDSFFSTLSPLIDYHNGILVNIDDIYRQYSYGIFSPYAIKTFLKNIYDNYGHRLKYALIAMQSHTYDWLNEGIKRPQAIPTMFTYTYNMGAVPCDYWYSVFDDNYWIPSISVGRFPVSSKAELHEILHDAINH